MPDIRLSAIIPNYNHATFIGHAIEALLAQQTPPDEIIVVDDASTDNSVEVVNTFISTGHSTIRLVALPENGGAIPALNRGLAEARGTYIYFGSADDVTLPNLFSSMLAMLAAHPTAAFACGETALTDLDGKLTGYRPVTRPSQDAKYFSPADVRQLAKHSDHWILTGAGIYRRTMIADAGGFDPTLGSFADGLVSKRLAFRHGFCFTPETVAVWKIDPKGYSRTTASDPAISERMIGKLKQALKADDTIPTDYPDLYDRRIRFAVCRLAALATEINFDLIERLGPSGPIDRMNLSIAKHLRPAILQRAILLLWLTLRMRPTSLFLVVSTQINRALGKQNSPTIQIPKNG